VRSIFWGIGGVLACVSGASAGVLFGTHVLGMKFQSAEFDYVRKSVGTAYERSLVAARKVRRELIAAAAPKNRVERALPPVNHVANHVASVVRVSPPLRSEPAKVVTPVLAANTLQNQTVRITRETSDARPTDDRDPALIAGLTASELRLALARDLERELQRAGCGVPHADGRWGFASRLEMKRFIRNIDAALPVDQPDTVLLGLVRGYHGSACGVGCGRSANDRCEPLHVTAPSDPAGDLRSKPRTSSHHLPAGTLIGQPAEAVGPAAPPVRWVAVPEVGQRKAAKVVTGAKPPQVADDKSRTVVAPTKGKDSDTANASGPGRMALGVPQPQASNPLTNNPASAQKLPASTPVAVRGTRDLPTALPAPYEPGAPRLEPERKSDPVAVNATKVEQPPREPERAQRWRRPDRSWRTRAFRIEN